MCGRPLLLLIKYSSDFKSLVRIHFSSLFALREKVMFTYVQCNNYESEKGVRIDHRNKIKETGQNQHLPSVANLSNS